MDDQPPVAKPTSPTEAEATPAAGRSAPGALSSGGLGRDPLWLRGLRCFILGGFVGSMSPLLRIRVHDRPDFEALGPCILAPNHTSFLDPPVLQFAAGSAHIRFLMTAAIWRLPVVNLIFRLWGAIPLPEGGRGAGPMKNALAALAARRLVGIFPEGGIMRDGQLGRGHPGVALLVAKSGLPVVPVGIRGAFEALPHGRLLARSVPIDVRFGQPMAPPPADDRQAARAWVKELMAHIAELSSPRR